MHPRDGVVVVANVHNGYTKYVADKVGWPVNWGPVNWGPTLETCCSKDPAQARRTSSPGRPSGERNFPDLIFRRQEDQHSPPLRWKDDLQGGTEITQPGSTHDTQYDSFETEMDFQ
jgi:hypothetical protein